MRKAKSKKSIAIAVVGIGSIFPGRGDPTGFWRDLFEGRDLLKDVPPSHWLIEDYYDANPRMPDRTYGKRGGFIEPIAFDPMMFGIPPKAMQATDTAQMLALIAAKMTLDDIERDSAGKIDKTRTSVILGVASATELTAHMAGRLQRPTWVNAMREAGLAETDVQDIAARISDHYSDWQEATFPGLLGNVVAGRIANRLDLGGSNYVTDAACASSLAALQIALHELRSGDSDTVLAGGVDALNDILMYMCFSKTPALSPTGDCRPFSTQADGTMLSEGVGMLALRRLADAERDGNTIHAVIRGLGGASDGKGTAVYAPLPAGQASALKRAYAQAGYGPDTVDLVEAHGTGTIAGDKAELAGLHQVFGQGEASPPWCALGSVKSQIGHSKGAAGAASLTKVVMALSRKVLPPTIKVDEPAEAISTSNAFYLNTEARPWVSAPGRPRRGSVSSFGFGGSNFHVALEEYTGPRAVKPYRTLPSELVLFSGASAAELAAAIETIAPAELSDAGLATTAEASHAGFDVKADARASIVASSVQDLRDKAAALAAQVRGGSLGTKPLKPGCAAAVTPATPGKIAFVFSGQGSQYVDMGADLAMAFPGALEVWNQAAAHPRVGALRLDRLAFPPAAFDQVEFSQNVERLTEMQHAQPAIAAVALSQLALLKTLGLKAKLAGGHSFGEIMALHYAGSLTQGQALTVAAERGALMAKAAEQTEGAMIAVQTDAQAVQPVLDKVGKDLVLANDNGLSQVVLSGPVTAIEAALEACKSAGLKAYRLPVATAFHSPIVASAVEPFAKVLTRQDMQSPKIGVFANATAKRYGGKTIDLPAKVASQIVKPVRFREQIEAMHAAGANVFVEIGPGAVVTGLIENILGQGDYQTIALDNKRHNGVTQFLSGLGALSVAGFKLNLSKLFKNIPAEPIAPPPSKHAIMISGANHAKPYPPANGASGRASPNRSVPSKISPPTSPSSDRTVSPMAKPDPNPVAVAAPISTLPQTTPVAASMTERIWQEISQRHADYLAVTSATHTEFLRMIGQVMSGVPVAPLAATLPMTAPVAAPIPAAAPVAAPVPATPPVMTSPAPISPPSALNGSSAMNGHAPATLMPVASPIAPAMDATALVRAIIAEKTGYPDDMLEPDMDLEGELGVDSIKQVEILSTLRERVPDLPEIDPEQLLELRTIGAIAAMLEGHLGASAPAPIPAPVARDPARPAANGGITADTVRALIAEKTGYPTDMLEDDMDLEGELGVDSIKQVEILSALRDQNPSLPEVDPEVLAELRTIRAIADFFS